MAVCVASSVPPPGLKVAQLGMVCAPASSLTAVGLVAVKLGMSLTGVTVMAAVSVVLLKAVLPPLVLVSAVLPFVPDVVSQARKVMPLVIVPL